jgi:hypothetical protein
VPDRMKLSVAVLLLPLTIFEDAWKGARRGGAAFGPLADDQAPLVQRKESDRSDRSHEHAERVRRDPKRTYVASVWTSRIDVKGHRGLHCERRDWAESAPTEVTP